MAIQDREKNEESEFVSVGTIKSFGVEKAACGIRIDQDLLTEDMSFDFSSAIKLKEQLCQTEHDASDEIV